MISTLWLETCNRAPRPEQKEEEGQEQVGVEVQVQVQEQEQERQTSVLCVGRTQGSGWDDGATGARAAGVAGG